MNKRVNLYSPIEVATASDVEFHVYLKTVFNLLQPVTNVDDINALLPVHVKGMVDLPLALKRLISFKVRSQFISDKGQLYEV